VTTRRGREACLAQADASKIAVSQTMPDGKRYTPRAAARASSDESFLRW
jgi:hypothetical protein